MKHQSFNIPNILHHDVMAVIVAGMLLLVGVIFSSPFINESLAADLPTSTQIATPLPVTPAISAAASPDPLTVLGTVMTDPRNFRVVPANIRPAQAFIEGKTVKFLMGL